MYDETYNAPEIIELGAAEDLTLGSCDPACETCGDGLGSMLQ